MSPKKYASVDRSRCASCGECTRVCPKMCSMGVLPR